MSGLSVEQLESMIGEVSEQLQEVRALTNALQASNPDWDRAQPSVALSLGRVHGALQSLEAGLLREVGAERAQRTIAIAGLLESVQCRIGEP